MSGHYVRYAPGVPSECNRSDHLAPTITIHHLNHPILILVWTSACRLHNVYMPKMHSCCCHVIGYVVFAFSKHLKQLTNKVGEFRITVDNK